MKIRKWSITAVMLAGMTAAFVPAGLAASIPTNGAGTVAENTTADSSQREFFTIKTADGNVFYIVVDKTKTDDNVYLLTPVTEESLKSLSGNAAKKNSLTTGSGTSGFLGSLSGSSDTSGEPTSSEKGSGSTSTGSTAKNEATNPAVSVGNIAFFALVAIVVFATAFYFKIYKQKHAQIPESFEDESEEGDEHYGNSDEDDEDEIEDEPEKLRKPAPVQKKVQPVPKQIQPEPTRRSYNSQPKTDTESEQDMGGTHVLTTPRPRHEDVWTRDEDGISESDEPEKPVNHSSRMRNGGLFAPDEPYAEYQAQEHDSIYELEEPEPEYEDNFQDFDVGMGLFGNPDQEV